MIRSSASRIFEDRIHMIFHTSNKMRSLKYPLIVTSLTEEQCTMCRDTTDISGGGFGEG